MTGLKHFALAALCAVLAASTAMAMDYYVPASVPSPAANIQPLNPQWRDNAYQGMVRQINPKHVQNVKFLFLGEPVPALARGGDGITGLQGYGGLVAIRKKSILWLVMDSIRFYLIDPNGNLMMLNDIDTMEADQVFPQFYDVVIDSVTTMQPNPRYRPSDHERKGRGRRRRQPEYIPVTEETKKVVARLSSQDYARAKGFFDAKVDDLPVRQ